MRRFRQRQLSLKSPRRCPAPGRTLAFRRRSSWFERKSYNARSARGKSDLENRSAPCAKFTNPSNVGHSVRVAVDALHQPAKRLATVSQLPSSPRLIPLNFNFLLLVETRNSTITSRAQIKDGHPTTPEKGRQKAGRQAQKPLVREYVSRPLY